MSVRSYTVGAIRVTIATLAGGQFVPNQLVASLPAKGEASQEVHLGFAFTHLYIGLCTVFQEISQKYGQETAATAPRRQVCLQP